MFNHPQHPTLRLRGKPRAYLSFSQDAALWGGEGRSHTTQTPSRHPARAPRAKVGDWQAWGHRGGKGRTPECTERTRNTDQEAAAQRPHNPPQASRTEPESHANPTAQPPAGQKRGGVRWGRGGLEAGPRRVGGGAWARAHCPLPDGDCSSGYKPGSLCGHWELRFPASERLRLTAR